MFHQCLRCGSGLDYIKLECGEIVSLVCRNCGLRVAFMSDGKILEYRQVSVTDSMGDWVTHRVMVPKGCLFVAASEEL